ncbi:MAG: hypothetical protein P8126_11135, partial [Gammaproteobacteria bacterium]
MNASTETQSAAAGPSTARERRCRRILLHSPDITLKGKNQDMFRLRLVENIRRCLRALGLDWPVGSARGRAYVDTTGRDGKDIAAAVAALADTAGVTSLADAVWLRPAQVAGDAGLNWPLLEDTLVDLGRDCFIPGA